MGSIASSVIGGVGSLVGAGVQSNAIDKATSAQVNAGRAAQANSQGWYDTAKGNYQPYMDTGTTALGTLGRLTQDPSTTLASDPGYQFRMQQGMQALQRSAAARGGLLSGGTLKGITDYSQGAASQEFGNAWNRQMGLAQLGMGATNSLTGVGNQTSNLQNQDITGVGNAKAAGTMAQANVWNNAINQMGNSFGSMAGSGGGKQGIF